MADTRVRIGDKLGQGDAAGSYKLVMGNAVDINSFYKVISIGPDPTAAIDEVSKIVIDCTGKFNAGDMIRIHYIGDEADDHSYDSDGAYSTTTSASGSALDSANFIDGIHQILALGAYVLVDDGTTTIVYIHRAVDHETVPDASNFRVARYVNTQPGDASTFLVDNPIGASQEPGEEISTLAYTGLQIKNWLGSGMTIQDATTSNGGGQVDEARSITFRDSTSGISLSGSSVDEIEAGSLKYKESENELTGVKSLVFDASSSITNLVDLTMTGTLSVPAMTPTSMTTTNFVESALYKNAGNTNILVNDNATGLEVAGLKLYGHSNAISGGDNSLPHAAHFCSIVSTNRNPGLTELDHELTATLKLGNLTDTAKSGWTDVNFGEIELGNLGYIKVRASSYDDGRVTQPGHAYLELQSNSANVAGDSWQILNSSGGAEIAFGNDSSSIGVYVEKAAITSDGDIDLQGDVKWKTADVLTFSDVNKVTIPGDLEVTGTIAGSTENVKITGEADAADFNIPFTTSNEADGSPDTSASLLTDSTSSFTYDPGNNTLTVPNIECTDITASTGITSTEAEYANELQVTNATTDLTEAHMIPFIHGANTDHETGNNVMHTQTAATGLQYIPSSQTLKNVSSLTGIDASGADTAGNDINIVPGLGTGTALSGDIVFKYNYTDASAGADVNSAVTAMTIDASAEGKVVVEGDAEIKGNLTVSGTQTTINTSDLMVSDSAIVLGTNAAGDDFFKADGTHTKTAIVFAGEGQALDRGIKLICQPNGFTDNTGSTAGILKSTYLDSTTFADADDTDLGALAPIGAAALVLDSTAGAVLSAVTGSMSAGTLVYDGTDLWYYD